MPRLLQQLLAPFDPIVHPAPAVARDAPSDEDIALGCECADPALQFESWEPASLLQQPAAAPY